MIIDELVGVDQAVLVGVVVAIGCGCMLHTLILILLSVVLKAGKLTAHTTVEAVFIEVELHHCCIIHLIVLNHGR